MYLKIFRKVKIVNCYCLWVFWILNRLILSRYVCYFVIYIFVNVFKEVFKENK